MKMAEKSKSSRESSDSTELSLDQVPEYVRQVFQICQA